MIPLPERISKCLIVKPSSLGDIIHSLPFLNAFHSRFPDTEIHWLLASQFTGLLEGHPMITRLWNINKSGWKKPSMISRTLGEIGRLAKDLRKERFEIVVDLQGLLRSGLISRLSNAPVRVGFSSARELSTFFYTHKVNVNTSGHAVDRYLEVAAELGCDVINPEFPMLHDEYPLPFDDYAVLAPGARWDTKRWPSESFGTLSSLLPIKSVIIGSPEDIERAGTVEKHASGNALNLAGKTTLREATAVIRNARFMITNDSGPMHIAAALGVPTYAIFGPTSPVLTGPYGQGHTIIRSIRTDDDCSPCFKRSCKDTKCMEGVSPAQVLGAIKKKSGLTF